MELSRLLNRWNMSSGDRKNLPDENLDLINAPNAVP